MGKVLMLSSGTADISWEINGANAANSIALHAIEAAERRVIFYSPCEKYISAQSNSYAHSLLGCPEIPGQ